MGSAVGKGVGVGVLVLFDVGIGEGLASITTLAVGRLGFVGRLVGAAGSAPGEHPHRPASSQALARMRTLPFICDFLMERQWGLRGTIWLVYQKKNRASHWRDQASCCSATCSPGDRRKKSYFRLRVCCQRGSTTNLIAVRTFSSISTSTNSGTKTTSMPS